MKHQIQISNVSRETIEKTNELVVLNETILNKYADLMIWWNSKVNIVSRSINKDALLLHLQHCLFLNEIIEGNDTLLDAGCGGGLPGIPLAIVNPDKSFLLNDKVAKKIMVVNDMLRKLELKNIQTKAVDLAKINLEPNSIGVISKHAFKISDLLALTQNFKPKLFYLLKGSDFKEELKKVNKNLTVKAVDLSLAGSFYKEKFMLKIQQND